MTSVPAGRTERGDRRARGDGLVWCLAGLVLVLLGWVAGWPVLVLLGAFMILPALLVLILLRRDRIRREAPPPDRSRE